MIEHVGHVVKEGREAKTSTRSAILLKSCSFVFEMYSTKKEVSAKESRSKRVVKQTVCA